MFISMSSSRVMPTSIDITGGSAIRTTCGVWLLLLNLLHGVLYGVLADTGPIFKSRPDLFPPVFTVEHRISDQLSPGYIFVGPYETDNAGPYIYDDTGELVWSGWGNSGPGNAHNPHVCQYKGEDHLCFFQGVQQHGYCRGHGVIMDRRYRIVKTVVAGGGMSSSDMHEFKLIDGGRHALVTVYQQRAFDLSAWNVRTGVGWVMESVFQEVDVETGAVRFEWRSLDHVDPSAGYTYPAHTDTSGTGLDPRSPWDYFHINSVEKNADGDYLVSARHTCAVYKISGRDGSILWQLHGADPSFVHLDDFSFSQQHDARWLAENATHTTLSLFNNGYNGYNRTHDFSSGMVIVIDHVGQTAAQAHAYESPPDRLTLSSSQGNMQVTEPGTVVVGWGNRAAISEHDAHGRLLFWGTLGHPPNSSSTTSLMNYRAQKFRWDGEPTDIPALWAYAPSMDPNSSTSSTTLYASWNGATRVRHWRFYGSTVDRTGPYRLLQQVVKNGFETAWSVPGYVRWSYVEAVDGQGGVLGRSQRRFTFTPSGALRGFCGQESCATAAAFGMPGEEDAEPFIPPTGINTVPWIDADHPETHFDWGETGVPEGYNAVVDEGEETWWMGVVVALMVAVGAITGVTLYRRRHRFTLLDNASTDSLEEMDGRKSSLSSEEMAWWNGQASLPEYHQHEYHPDVSGVSGGGGDTVPYGTRV